jgi:Lipopolysaccharide kinase (Kdo/WaaP) family
MSTGRLMNTLGELGFRETAFGRSRLYLAAGIAGQGHEIGSRLRSVEPAREPALGNRRSAVPLTIAGLPPMFVRRYRRGGLMRFLVAELYAGLAPRPLHELAVTASANKRGLPVVEPLGAMVEWVGPCLYRGWFLTRALEGTTLWDLMLSGEQKIRRQALQQARSSIDRIHDGGLVHADLNFHNLLVCTGAVPLHVVILDLDKARIHPGSLRPSMRQANFRRLERSARKLIDAGASLSPEERAILGIDQGQAAQFDRRGD